MKNITTMTATKNNAQKDEKEEFVFNPVDSFIRINASKTVKKSILSQPWFCQGYVDCMELLPGAKDMIVNLRKKQKDVDIILETPYHEEIVEAVADKFHIPYARIRRVKSPATATLILQVEMQLKKMAS